ncbi:MAG: bifunctional DNA-formamidopyrimidine glycosylase/DNA-(apurinic or apyrimidinic site) lyase [Bdellovibrionales bacterium]|nr:bifunctional DNA-formamidopyrimidine glycosylase/DNA-(apurinic or apyrimidinic site) lyase [Bdellovibrionales bacterium]
MPELPEVEVLVRQLDKAVRKSKQLKSVSFMSPKLRTELKIPKTLRFPLEILKIYRRSKFIIFEFDGGFFISHLGMSGSWRIVKKLEFKKHDHIVLDWGSSRYWVYNDPRRFGIFEYSKVLTSSPWIKKLGQEPLVPDFDFIKWSMQVRKSQRAVKDLLMDSKIIVGVGNIYACESLFLSGINPFKAGSSVSVNRLKNLLLEVQKVLQSAIKNGGSSIQNYAHTNGEKGLFQKVHKVYGREGEGCLVCGTFVKKKFLHGRGTFWCPSCQK